MFLLAFCQVHLLQSLLLVYDSLFLKAMKKEKKKKKIASRKVHSPRLTYQCVAPNNQSVPREFSSSSFLISSQMIILARVKGKIRKRSRTISDDSRTILFTLLDCWLDDERYPRKDEDGKNKSTTSMNGPVAAVRLVKEFSAGCGTRSFLGDDVLKFTMDVRSTAFFRWHIYLVCTSSTGARVFYFVWYCSDCLE